MGQLALSGFDLWNCTRSVALIEQISCVTNLTIKLVINLRADVNDLFRTIDLGITCTLCCCRFGYYFCKLFVQGCRSTNYLYKVVQLQTIWTRLHKYKLFIQDCLSINYVNYLYKVTQVQIIFANYLCKLVQVQIMLLSI